MSTYTIRPTSLIAKDNALQGTSNSGTAWATATNAQIASYLGDNSDTTGVRSSGSGSRYFQLNLGVPSIASDEFIARISSFVRWSEGKAGKYVGAGIYLDGESVPAGVGATGTDGRATPTTTELGYQYSRFENYLPSATSGVNLTVFLDGATNGIDRPWLWDAGAIVYTLQRATAAPTATSWSASTYATIPVDVTATIGWEADSYAWENLRKITVEIRVEQGGASIGSGTLVSTTTKDVYFDETGTQTVDVTLADSLSNGSYRVYARAIRHRERETYVADDQVGPWSSGVALTMSVTPPSAPTISATAENAQGRTALTLTAVQNGMAYTSPFVTVERSVDGGVTWTQVRGLSAVSCTFGVPVLRYDYEAPRGVTVHYRARTSAYITGALNTSLPSTESTASLLADKWNLKCPKAPNLNMIDVRIVGNPGEDIAEDIGIFRPEGRRYPVTVSGSLTGWDGDLGIVTIGATEWEQVKALIESQQVLYLESPFGWAKYLRISAGAKTTMKGSATRPIREIALAYVEVSSPSGSFVTVSNQFGATVDFGTASTTTWDGIYDGGSAAQTVDGIVDGGQAA